MIKKLDLPTFSINPKATDDKHKRIVKLITQVNESNRETLNCPNLYCPHKLGQFNRLTLLFFYGILLGECRAFF